MKLDDFLITTSVGDISRKFTWRAHGPIDIDLPHGWVMEKTYDKLRFRDETLESYQLQLENALSIPIPEPGRSQVINLPAVGDLPTSRPIAVEVVRLKPLKPVYIADAAHAPVYPASINKQLTMFYGQRYFLVRFRPVSTGMVVNLGDRNAFEYGFGANGYWIAPRLSGLKIKFANGKRASIEPGQTFNMTEPQFFSATVIVGVHWWRFRMVPTPDALPPIESDETEDQMIERQRFQQSTGIFSIFFTGFLLVLYALSLGHKEPKIVATHVELKAPKIIPPSMVAAQPTPVPTPVPTPPPVAPTPPPPKVAEKKPTPPPKIAKTKPKPEAPAPKKVAKAPPPKAPPKAVEPPSSPQPPPPPTKVAQKEPPSSAGQAAAEHAKEVQAQQQQLAQKLGFLSTSSKRAVADPTTYESKSGKFTNTPTVGGLTSKSNSLDKIAKGAVGDGMIRTNSARSVASDVDFGTRRGKGLNDVQGKVSAGELASGGTGKFGDLGGGSLSVTGPGSLTDAEIEKALAKYLQKFQFCYEKALLSNAGLGGNVVMQWHVMSGGSTSGTKVVSSQLNNEALHSCMSKILDGIKFPSPKGGEVIIKKTFSFSSSSL